MMVRPAPCSSPQQGEDIRGRRGVQVAGRLVGEQQVGLGDQGPGDRDPLLLAAGQLARPVLDPVAEANPVQRRDGALAPLRPADTAVGERQLDVAPAQA